MNLDQRPFTKVHIDTEIHDLYHGDEAHTESNNSTYIKVNDEVIPFCGNRINFKIELEEYNYIKYKSSYPEVRNRCLVKVWANNTLVYEAGARSYEQGYKIAQRFIDDAEMYWNDLLNPEQLIANVVAYKEQLFVIKRLIQDQCALILIPLFGERSLFLDERGEDIDMYDENILKVNFFSDNLYRYVKLTEDEQERLDYLKKTYGDKLENYTK